MQADTDVTSVVQDLYQRDCHRQIEVFEVLDEHGPMTSREIADRLGEADNNVGYVLRQLRSSGYIETRPDIRCPTRFIYEVADDE